VNAIARDQARVTKPATLAGSGLALAVVAFVGTALADAAWGWGGLATALYSLGSILLMVSAFLLVVTQVQVSRAHGGLGRAALIGVGISALGALLTGRSWSGRRCSAWGHSSSAPPSSAMAASPGGRRWR